MNYRAIAFAAILGFSTPIMITTAINSPVIAAPKYSYPTGSFSNDTWNISLTYNNNTYRYKGLYIPKQTHIELVGAKASGNHERQVYTWVNNGLKYQVAWRPSDPDTIRVLVVTSSGKTNLSTLLTRDTH
jgi:hypothetical protein